MRNISLYKVHFQYISTDGGGDGGMLMHYIEYCKYWMNTVEIPRISDVDSSMLLDSPSRVLLCFKLETRSGLVHMMLFDAHWRIKGNWVLEA